MRNYDEMINEMRTINSINAGMTGGMNMKTKDVFGPVKVDVPNLFERFILRKKENVHAFGINLGTVAETKAKASAAVEDALIISLTVGGVLAIQNAVEKATRKEAMFKKKGKKKTKTTYLDD